MASRRSPSRSFDASIVQTWENKCKRGSVLDYETLKCVSASSARGKELMSAERRAKAVLASGKTTRQKLFGVMKVAGALTGGAVAAYLAYLASSSATSAAFARLLRSASTQASVDVSRVVKAAEAAPKPVDVPRVVIAAKDTTKTLLKKTVRALVAAGFIGMIFGKMRVSGGGGGGGGGVPESPRNNPFDTPAAIQSTQPQQSPQRTSPATVAYVPESPRHQFRQRGGTRGSSTGLMIAERPQVVNVGHFVASRSPTPTWFTKYHDNGLKHDAATTYGSSGMWAYS